MKIKTKILKEVWITNKLLDEAKKILPLEIQRTEKAIDLTIAEVLKVIDESDCDCDEFNGFKTCGRCQVLQKLGREE